MINIFGYDLSYCKVCEKGESCHVGDKKNVERVGCDTTTNLFNMSLTI